MNNKNEHKVKFIKFSDGERYPLLINSKGIPHWYVTLFTTTQIRNASKAPNTIAAVLSAIKVLLDWADSFNIDLALRFTQRNFLTEQELESLRNHTQTKLAKKRELTSPKVIPLCKNSERSRSIIQKNMDKVTSSTQYIRMSYQSEYLKWLAMRIIEQEAKFIDDATLKSIKFMSKSFSARRPNKSISSRERARKGLRACSKSFKQQH